MIESQFPGWKRVTPPPPGYFHVLRRSFRSQLHILIFVLKSEDHYTVRSVVENNTLRGIDKREGTAATFPELLELLRVTCAQWDEPLPMESLPVLSSFEEYFYVDPQGKMTGPVSREGLFDLLQTGILTWESQAWDGGWQPVLRLLGFPPKAP